MKTKVVAEIGINHNGNMCLAKDMILSAKACGCNFVKLQKRTPIDCVPECQKNTMKDTPWGRMSYIQYKNHIEFTEEQVKCLNEYATSNGIFLFASVWDIKSVDVMKNINNDIVKIPSALITDIELCKYARKHFKTVIISTGMSTEDEIEKCILSCNPDVIMHTNSTYPCPAEDLNLKYILHLKEKYPGKEIGYSGHELENITSASTILYGATWIEKHFTLSNDMWGSDQKSSIDPYAMRLLVEYVHTLEVATQYEPQNRILFEKENSKKLTLRKT